MTKQTKQVELQQLIESHVTNPAVQKHMIELTDQAQQEAVLDGGAKMVSEIYNKFYKIIDDQEEMYQWFRKEMTGEIETPQKEQE